MNLFTEQSLHWMMYGGIAIPIWFLAVGMIRGFNPREDVPLFLLLTILSVVGGPLSLVLSLVVGVVVAIMRLAGEL